jgi:RNA recognition motif-containing protein
MNIYVGNLNFRTSEDDLRAHFEQHGAVESAKIICDEMKRSKGFGFVTMSNYQEAKAALAALDGKELDGRTLKVNEARRQGR